MGCLRLAFYYLPNGLQSRLKINLIVTSMKTTPTWYAVYTKPNFEKKVAELLFKKGLRNYCPVNKVLRQWHDRKKWIEEPLITSYVFVHITPVEQPEVRKIPGVINFVYWLGKPAVIKDAEIESMYTFLQKHGSVVLQKTNISISDQVQINQGALKSQEGTVVEVLSNTVKVMLPSVGFALIAQVDKAHIELTKPGDKKLSRLKIRA